MNNLYCICNDTSRTFTNCSGNGQCDDGGCDCYDGYYGATCQFSICSPPCRNGGVCEGLTGTCNCQNTGFEGPTCTDSTINSTSFYWDSFECVLIHLAALPPVCSPTCQHGGTCIQNGVCDCSGTQYFGPYCSSCNLFPRITDF